MEQRLQDPGRSRRHADWLTWRRSALTPVHQTLKAAQDELAHAERALAQPLRSDQHPTEINTAIPTAEARIAIAHDTVARAKANRDAYPAKLPANVINPDVQHAQAAHPGPGPADGAAATGPQRRALARRPTQPLYLQDPDEYRAITRNLLHQGGQLTYTPQAITVTLDRPATPD